MAIFKEQNESFHQYFRNSENEEMQNKEQKQDEF